MKQIIQNLKNGQTVLEDVPAPQVKNGCVLIQTTKSLVSLGTERMLVEFGQANLIQKARQQPEKVKMVLDKIKTDGLIPTLEAVFTKLGQPLPLGYCNTGKVIAVGEDVNVFKIGDRVASNGQHAEFVCVPQNLVAKIPDSVSDDEATFTVIGSIGLQGIRLLKPTFGETIVVVGLGLIGLITAQLLKANGCDVIGFDYDQSKVDLALAQGIKAVNPGESTNQVEYVLEQSGGIGCDGVIITASNKSSEIISQAAKMSRKRGRIVLVGVIGLELNRTDFYEKELSFQVSCSYGPGRYDPNYEDKGNDYPIGFVRWTEKRNFESVLSAIASGRLDVKSLITTQVTLENYQQIYSDMNANGQVASIMTYPEDSVPENTITVTAGTSFEKGSGIGIIGAGNFTGATLIPSIKGLGNEIKYIASAGGLSAANLAKKAKSAQATTDYKQILNDDKVGLVIITTRHNLHAQMILESLKSGKHVFVEKPLCLNNNELEEIIQAQKDSGKTVSVGFNRRFAPLAEKLKSLVGNGSSNIVMNMNAGFIPPDVWLHDMEIGGGRIIGEACHFIDLCAYLSDSKVTAVCANSMGTDYKENSDNVSILLKFENGSNGVINYFANGAKSYSKERIEVYQQGKTFVLDNWRKLSGYGIKGFSKAKSNQDKGHKNQFAKLFRSFKDGGEELIPFDSIVNTTQASFAAVESLKQQAWIKI